MAAFKKIKISPESSNYGDNDKNVAYLYRGYYIWQGERSGLFDAWNFAPAVLHVPKADETFEPYWDDDGDAASRPTRSSCIKAIDSLYDPDDQKNVTLTVSLNEARTILAALNRRCGELASLGGEQSDELLAEAKNVYHSVDRQASPPRA